MGAPEQSLFPKDFLYEMIEKTIDERLYNVAYLKVKDTVQYNAWVDESINLSHDIIDNLGLNSCLFLQYEELSNLKENALLRNAYKQGFVDGIIYGKAQSRIDI